MPSRIVEAAYLHYSNPARNSDKVFNIILVEEDDGSYSCVSEYGRARIFAGSCCHLLEQIATRCRKSLQKKLDAKRNHRETPYWASRAGSGQSPYAKELSARSVPASTISTPAIADHVQTQKQAVDRTVRASGILNQGQIDSLEF